MNPSQTRIIRIPLLNRSNPQLPIFAKALSPTLFSIILSISLAVTQASAQLQLPNIFSSGMVLQRDVPLPLWGTAAPAAVVTVTFNTTTQPTFLADSAGRWKIAFPAMGAGGPFEITVSSGGQQITISNIYVGDVWLASGQSNIEFTLNNAEGGAAAIAAANDQLLRQFKVQKGLANEPSDDLPSGSVWTPATLGSISTSSSSDQRH